MACFWFIDAPGYRQNFFFTRPRKENNAGNPEIFFVDLSLKIV
jgi:hypothetical protein